MQDLPNWNYDGSSTGQAPGHDSEVYLVPRCIFKDPFRGGDNILVMCDCYEPPRLMPDGTVTPLIAIPTNTRAACAEACEKAKEHEPWFGIEQVRACAEPGMCRPIPAELAHMLHLFHPYAGVHPAQLHDEVAPWLAQGRLPRRPGPLLLLRRRWRVHCQGHLRGALQVRLHTHSMAASFFPSHSCSHVPMSEVPLPYTPNLCALPLPPAGCA